MVLNDLGDLKVCKSTHISKFFFARLQYFTTYVICMYGKVINKHRFQIERDMDFWENEMHLPLTTFYIKCLLPEIIDPRHRRKKRIY